MAEFKEGEIVKNITIISIVELEGKQYYAVKTKTGVPTIEEVNSFDSRYGKRDENVKQLAHLVDEAKKKLEEACKFADEHSLHFYWDSDYGSRKQQYIGNGCEEMNYYSGQSGWVSSSDGC